RGAAVRRADRVRSLSGQRPLDRGTQPRHAAVSAVRRNPRAGMEEAVQFLPQMGPADAVRAGPDLRQESGLHAASPASPWRPVQERAAAVGEGRLPVKSATGKGEAMTRRRWSILAIVTFLATACGSARAQEWQLNSDASRFYMQTVKANSIMETHQFKSL